MRRPTRIRARTAMRALAAVAAMTALGRPGPAEAAVLDQVSAESGSLAVQFTCPMLMVSHYPKAFGDVLTIELQPLIGCPAVGPEGEMLPVPGGNPNGLVEVRLDASLGTRRTLTLRFARIMEFTLRPRPGSTGIEVVLARREGRNSVEFAAEPAKPSRPPSRALPSAEVLERELAEARGAMQARDYDKAIRLYTRLLEYPEHAGRPLAQEYLGLARERKGQLAQAKREYEEFLHRYPDHADVPAVAQRLAALVTLDGASKPEGDAPDGSRWRASGALSQDYRHDTNSVSSSTSSMNGIGQSALDTEADLQVRHRGDTLDASARVFAGYVRSFGNPDGSSASETLVSQAFLQLDDVPAHWTGRVGRQSQVAGGVFGTFDGASFSWRATPGMRFNAAAGAPLDTYGHGVSHGREFGALSVDFLGVLPGLDLTAFGYEGKVDGVLDARQLGGEVHYYQNGHSVVGQLDYDVAYHVLDAGTVLATWSLPDRWILTAIGDRRLSPFVSTYNALVGQTASSLSSLEAQFGEAEVRQLARDRSAASTTATLGLQRPVGERLQWSNDLSFNRLGGMPASGGIAAVPSWGTATTFSSSLVGGGWLREGDMNSVGIGFGSRAGTRGETLFMSSRYPIGDRLRIGPRLQLSHTSGNDPTTGTSAGWSASPSVLAEWRFLHGFVNGEMGYERSAFDAAFAPGVALNPNATQPGTLNEKTTRFWFGVGYNLRF